MKVRNEYYACDNGRDYLMSLSEGDRVIRLISLADGRKTEHKFRDHHEAIDQLKLWRSNSIPRMPKTFGLCTKMFDVNLARLRETLAIHDLTLPEQKDLKDWIVFHGHSSMAVEGPWDYQQNIPLLDLPFLLKVTRGKTRNERKQQPMTGGIFSNV